MKRLPVRQGVVLALALVALAAVIALWLGVFRQEQAAASVPVADLVVTISPDPPESTPVASGSVVHYDIAASNIGDAIGKDIGIGVWVDGGNLNVQAFPGTCMAFGGFMECTADIPAKGFVTLSVDVDVTAAPGASLYVGAYVDAPTTASWYGDVLESEFGRKDFGDDEALQCGHVGEDEDVNLKWDGVQLEPDNYDCTKHDVVAAATPTPSPTPTPTPSPTPTATTTPTPEPPTGVLHNCPLPGKWAISVWDGPSGTATADALATCGDVSINAVYSLDPATNMWSRYFPGSPINTLLSVDDMQAIITHGQ